MLSVASSSETSAIDPVKKEGSGTDMPGIMSGYPMFGRTPRDVGVIHPDS